MPLLQEGEEVRWRQGCHSKGFTDLAQAGAVTVPTKGRCMFSAITASVFSSIQGAPGVDSEKGLPGQKVSLRHEMRSSPGLTPQFVFSSVFLPDVSIWVPLCPNLNSFPSF